MKQPSPSADGAPDVKPSLEDLLSQTWRVVSQVPGPPPEIYQPEMVETTDGEHVICRLADFPDETREGLARCISMLPELMKLYQLTNEL